MRCLRHMLFSSPSAGPRFELLRDRRPSIPDPSPRLRAPAEPSAHGRARAASRIGCRVAVARLVASDPTQAVSGASKASPARARKCRSLRAPVHERTVRRVIGEQQRAQVRPGALRVGTADHNKLFAVEVLDLQPRAAAIAGPIGRVDALRHHAVRLDLACMSKELAALPNDA
jgi:hypothetical protein